MLISSWILSIAVIVLGAMWFAGKGLQFISGKQKRPVTAASKQRRAAEYQARLGKVCGMGMMFIGLQLCVYCAFEFSLPPFLGWIVPWGLLGTLTAMVIAANTWAKR